MSKKITELDFIENIDDSALFLTRPNGSTDDKKITARSLLDSIGNPNVKGFNASVVEPGVLQLIPVNDGFNIGGYIEGMTISFISPITTTDEIYLKLEGLGNRKLSILNSIELCVIKENEYIEAVYIGDNTTGEFKRTNLVENTIITNEYNAEASINISDTITTYKLTSAIGTPKTQYYKGMSALFTSPIKSKGLININIDNLGDKTLAEPVGDVVPFKLYENQAVMAIYNGSYFNKHIFSPVEPFDPEGTVVNIYVSPFADINTIIKNVIKDYGMDGGGKTVVLQLPNAPLGGGNFIIFIDGTSYNIPWLTINGNETSGFGISGSGYVKMGDLSLNITGNFVGYTYIHILYNKNNISFVDFFCNDLVIKNLTFVPSTIILNIENSNITFSQADLHFVEFISITNSTINFNINDNNKSIIIQSTNVTARVYIKDVVSTAAFQISVGTTNIENYTFSGVSAEPCLQFISRSHSNNAILNNVNIKTSSSVASLSLFNSPSIPFTIVTADNCDFFNSAYPNNIIVNGSNAKLYKTQTVLGTTQTLNGGQVINI